MKLDILVIASHPDDAELGCGGTIAKHVDLGHKVGVVDLTRGELGTRGTPEIRSKEAEEAARILGLSVRKNLGFRDGFFRNDEEHQLALIKTIRAFQPEVVLASAIFDRHPDHGRASKLAYDASFLSGLVKIETRDDSGSIQKPWRPKRVFHYIQSLPVRHDFVVDVTGYWDKKIAAIKAFKSQMYVKDSVEPQTYISSPHFLEMVKARAIEFGFMIGKEFGEGFTADRPIGVNRLGDIL